MKNFECTQKCGERFDYTNFLESHLKNECMNTEIRCIGFIGCKTKDRRANIKNHQITCEYATSMLELIEPLNQKLFEQEKQIEILKFELKKNEQEKFSMKTDLEKLRKFVYSEKG